MTETHQAGETLRITAVITDTAGATATPATTLITIKKPDGTLDITGAAMSSDVAGTYYYDYAIPTDTGMYYTSVKATGSSARITIEPGSFMVGAAI